MNITLSKHIFGDINIKSSNPVKIYGPNNIIKKQLSDLEIEYSIHNPIGTPPLSIMAQGCKKILIVTDDNTRETPLIRIIPPILKELEAAGINKKHISFLIGLGTHRPMSPNEIIGKFGRDIVENYRIMNHAWDDPDQLISLGKCKLGFEVIINKQIQDADLIISIGSIVPHATAGFSGGGKTLMPGICGEKTIENTHWMALDYAMHEILGKFKNPIREEINHISRTANLKMIVNSVLINGNEIYGLVSGDLVDAHEEGVKICKEIYGVKVEEKSEIVLAEAYPTDIDLRQAIKAICSADIVCKDNGVIILTADCPEGVSPQFPDFSKYGFKNPDKLYREVEDGIFKQKLMAYTLVAIGRIISQRVRAILVSPNISRNASEAMGFIFADNLQNALDKSIEMTDKNASVTILKQAGEILPIIQNN